MRLMSNFVVHLRIPKFQKKKNCTLMFEIGFMPVKGEQGISYAKKGSPDPFNLVAESQNCQVILLIYTHFILTCVHFVTRGCVCVCGVLRAWSARDLHVCQALVMLQDTRALHVPARKEVFFM